MAAILGTGGLPVAITCGNATILPQMVRGTYFGGLSVA